MAGVGVVPAPRRIGVAAATPRRGDPLRRRSRGRGGTTGTTAVAAVGARRRGTGTATGGMDMTTSVVEAEVGMMMTDTMAGIKIAQQIGPIQGLGHPMMVLELPKGKD